MKNSKADEEKGNYALVNGLNIYYETHGTGKPLILLHGGVNASESFDLLLPILTKDRQVIAVHLQAHGRTADIDRPLSFEAMADDIAALINHLNIEKADIMGHSIGGGVALQTAIRHREVVNKLVIISATVKRDGWYPEVLEGMAQMGPEAAKVMKGTPLYRLYLDVNWEVLFTKLGNLLRQDYDWSEDVAAIKSPMIIAFADADSVRAEHIMEFFALLGGGLHDAGLDGSKRPKAWFAVIPGATHYNILSFSVLATFAVRFLDIPVPDG